MAARDEILGRIRTGLHRGADAAVAAQAEMLSALSTRDHGPKPAMECDARGLLNRFQRKSEALSTTVRRVARESEAPTAAADYLAAMDVPQAAVIWPALQDLDWAGAGVEIEARGAHDADLVGITGCFCAVAETGTLLLCSSAQTPATVSLLPETHIAIVRASRILPYMEDAFDLARRELGRLPRALNFISGPSRTGDIEQTIVLGAHGPYRVHVIVIEDHLATEAGTSP